MQILDQFGNLTNGTAGVMLTIGTNPSRLAFTGRPFNSTGGPAMSPPITVTLQDAGGNTVTTSGTSITLGISTGSGATGATMTSASATTTNGVATFTGSTIDKSGTSYRLPAASGTPDRSHQQHFQHHGRRCHQIWPSPGSRATQQ